MDVAERAWDGLRGPWLLGFCCFQDPQQMSRGVGSPRKKNQELILLFNSYVRYGVFTNFFDFVFVFHTLKIVLK